MLIAVAVVAHIVNVPVKLTVGLPLIVTDVLLDAPGAVQPLRGVTVSVPAPPAVPKAAG